MYPRLVGTPCFTVTVIYLVSSVEWSRKGYIFLMRIAIAAQWSVAVAVGCPKARMIEEIPCQFFRYCILYVLSFLYWEYFLFYFSHFALLCIWDFSPVISITSSPYSFAYFLALKDFALPFLVGCAMFLFLHWSVLQFWKISRVVDNKRLSGNREFYN